MSMIPTIKITRTVTRRAPNGAADAGTIKAYRNARRVAVCHWSGNLGEDRADDTVIEQLVREVGPNFDLLDRDQLGDECRTEYRDGRAVAAEVEAY